METVEVVSRTPHKYAERLRAVGERYQAEAKFVEAMVHMGWIEDPRAPSIRSLPMLASKSRTKRTKSKGTPR